MTSLLFVNQHYHPDVASTGQHLTDLAEHLAARGFEVEVIAGRGRYTAGALSAPDGETRNGVRITRVRSTGFGRRSHAGRIVDYATFYARVLRRLLAGPRVSGVVFLTTPPLLHVAGWLARRLRGQPYGVWSMDLHPEAEVASGMLRERGALARLLGWAAGRAYREADFVVDLGPHMKARLLARGVAAERCHTVHVWSDGAEIAPSARDGNPLRTQLGVGDRFVVMYSGNAGIVHDFDAVLEAMRRLRDDPSFYFLFVGGGPQRPRIERFAARHALTNFTYRNYYPRRELRHSLGAADAHIVTLRAPFVGISVPGKLYGIMAAGRPVLFVGPRGCESAEAVLQGECGVVVDPADEEAGGEDTADRIVSVLQHWRDNPAEACARGTSGRDAFLARYERAPNARAFEAVIRECWGAPAHERVRARAAFARAGD